MKTAVIRLVLLLCLVLPSVVPGAERPRVGLVLGGGGAAGVAHVGVLKVLEQNNIPVDVIAGTSMGAIVGSLYASGLSADELEKVVYQLDWIKLFRDGQPRSELSFHQKQESSGFFQTFELGIGPDGLRLPGGLVAGQKLMFELRRLLAPVGHINDFDRLPIPFRAVATDIETGEQVVLDHGNLPQAVRASMAIPGVFSPVRIDNRLLVDGFVSNNVPVNVARAMGADILIVVNIPTFLEKQSQLHSALDISYQAMQLMMLKTSQPQIDSMRPQDILIEPAVKNIGNLDFNKVRETIPLGEQAARARLGQLQQLARQTPQGRKGTEKYTQVQGKRILSGVRISRVDIHNDSGLDDWILRDKLGIRVGDLLNPEQLQRGLDRIYSLGYFELVDHRIDKEPGGHVLVVNAVKSSTSRQGLRLGWSLTDDLQGDAAYQLGARYVRKGINGRGGEWSVGAILGDTQRLESALYQPIPEWDAFIDPKIWHERRDYYAYVGSSRLAEVRGRETGGEIDIGRQFGNDSEARFGVFLRHMDPSLKTGANLDELDNMVSAGAHLSYRIDTTDDDLFPGQGRRLGFTFTQGLESLGSDENFQRLDIDSTFAWLQGKNRIRLRTELGTTFDDSPAFFNKPGLGGIGRLSGIPEDQLRGNHKLMVSGAYLYNLMPLAEVGQLFAGMTLEAGNVWSEAGDISLDTTLLSGSLFVGADTPLGPAFVGVGKTEGYEVRPFLFLGRSF
ncbi:MAG TPA: patatin-like phospholipase family protein [Thiolinea sp.]|nr:patatin-like phospholipase family protein [Thiolinea sp.]